MSGKDLQAMESIRRSQRPLLSSCALASAMVALGHAPAMAQSFQGTVIGTPTNATVNNSVPGQTSVTVTAPTAIVNWQPTDTAAGSAPIDFQGAGTTATYQSSGGDYTVLNRIVPTGSASGRSVLLNGTINSYIGDAAENQRGGAVWFYSPNGLVIGSQASIGVGSLLLTTRNLTDSQFLTSNGIYDFGAADNSRSSVTIQAGAQINAESVTGSSYVAVVAPRIVQAGTVRVGGSAAYVAAEQATLTIAGGLFNIQVQSGSAVDAGTPGDDVTLSHTGSTTGPALSSSGNPQAIYMVAIPKNVAITMLVGGNVGYDVNAAVEDNGSVILSAGSGVDSSGFLTGGPASGVGANLTIAGGSNFTSATRASARTDALAQTGAGGSLTFDKGFTLTGGRSATLGIGDNGTVTVGRDLAVATTNRDDADNAARGTAAINLGANATLTAGSTRVDASANEFSGDAAGGFASVTAGAGSTLTLQSLAILADASISSDDGTGGDATAGSALLDLNGSQLTASNSIRLSADAFGGNGLTGGAATGGDVTITLAGGSGISSFGDFSASADAFGGSGGYSGGGGDATGGDIDFTIADASAGTEIDVGYGLSFSAQGNGGQSINDFSGSGAGGNGGDGTGGRIAVRTGSGTITTDFSINLDATGSGGSVSDSGGNGGTGTGGDVTLDAGGATLDVGSINLEAGGFGASAGEFGYGSAGGDGGAGIGGAARLLLGTGSITTQSLSIDASADGGNGGDGGTDPVLGDRPGGNGGNATSGLASLDIDGGTVTISENVRIEAEASGGRGAFSNIDTPPGAGGIAVGGSGPNGGAVVNLRGGGTLSTPNLSLSADAFGGDGGYSFSSAPGVPTGGNGGEATGGRASVTVTGADLTVSQASISARGLGGNADLGSSSAPLPVSGSGTGGLAELVVTNGNASFDTLNIDATATGGGYSFVTAGNALGGTARLAISGGSLGVTESFSLDAFAQGVAGAGPAPTVTGGSASFSAANGAAITFDPGNLTIDASALLLDNFSEGFAASFDTSFAALGVGEGNVTGGTATFTLDGTTMDLDGLVLDAGGYANPAGASVHGGTATATVSNGGALTVAGGVELLVSGFATDGAPDGTGQGGNGSGGTATLRLDGGSLAASNVYIDARGRGGDSTLFTPGGDGTGGAIVIDIASRAGQPAALTSQQLTAQADGTGGSALIDNNTNTSGRDGGTGTGGTITMTVGGTLTLAGGEGGSELDLSANGLGGDAFAGGTGGAGSGGSVTLATIVSPGGPGSITASRVALAADGTGGQAIDPGIAIELPALDPTAANGGNGSGGAIALGVAGGGIAAANGIDVSAIGTGQNGAAALADFSPGAGGNAGDGAGGAFTLNLGGGSLAAPLSVAVNAVAGSGGNGSTGNIGGDGGAGGDATGGAFTINLSGAATNFDLPGAFTLDLSALAGNGGDAGDASGGPGANGGNGGNAIGGNLSLAAASSGGNLSLGSLDFNGSATGGNGGRGGVGTSAGTAGNGGSGTGGSLALAAGPGTLTIGDTNAVLNGQGGDGGAGVGGNGGNGTGGAFDAQATGGTIQLGALTVTSNGTGGSSAAGAGGNGSGGQIRVATADTPSGTAGQITALATSLTANGTAGSGATAGTANAGGIAISQTSASSAGLIRFASLDATTQGAGGTGAALVANGGSIAVTGAANVNASGPVRLSGINGGTIVVGGNLVATAGAGATAGNVSANSIILTAASDILFEDDVTGTSRLTAQSTGGSTLTNGPLTLTGGTGPGGLLQLLSPNGINAPGAALVTGGTAQFYLGSGDFIVDSLTVGNRIDTIDASFNFTDFRQLVSAGAIRIGGTTSVANGNLDLSAGTDLALGEVVAGNDIRLSAPGAVSATSLEAGDDIFVDGGSIAVGSATTTGLGTDDETGYGGDGLGNIFLTAQSGIAVDDIDAFGSVSATDGDGGIAIDTLRAGGNVDLSSSDGAVVVATDLAANGFIGAFGTDVTLRAIGDLTIDSITATTGDILIGTGGSVDVRSASAGNSLTIDSGSGGSGDARLFDAVAGNAINITTRGLATLVGVFDAPTINVASYDIAIVGGEGPALIGLDTDSITLTNIGSSRTYVGGGDVSDAWSLSNDEFGRLSAHNIAIVAAGDGESGGNMTIGQLDIIGAVGTDTDTRRRNLTGSDLLLSARGEILANGAVSLTGAGADDRLTLAANDRILVDTATGAISVTGQGSAPGGTLVMDAPTIFVGTAQAWTDISAMTGIDAKNQRLGLSDGVNNPEGFLRANAMAFRASQGLYIQNSGTDTRPPEERAGFTVGPGGVTIVTQPNEGAPLEIVINGRQVRADGTFVTGADLIPLLRLQGGGDGEGSTASFDSRSTANGCFIIGASCTTDRPIDTGIPQQDIINALDPDPDFSGETGLVPTINPPIIQFADPIGLSADPVIDEPVTGAANENLWLGDAGAGGPSINQQVTGTRNDDEDQATPSGQPIGGPVTGTRNDSLDEQVTGTRNDTKDEAEKPKP